MDKLIDTLQIRLFREEDKMTLIELLKKNIPTHFAESELQDFIDYIKNELERYYVAEIDGNIVGGGGINFLPALKLAKISWDFIDPDFQGRGIGQKLLQHRLDVLKSMPEIQDIQVRTSQLAYRFYEKSGFLLQDVKKDHWATGFDLYDMRLKNTDI